MESSQIGGERRENEEEEMAGKARYLCLHRLFCILLLYGCIVCLVIYLLGENNRRVMET